MLKKHFIIIALALISTFIFGFANQMSIPTFTVYLGMLDVPLQFIGGISLSLAIAALVFRPIAAYLIHRFGAASITILGASIAVISFTGYTFLSSIFPVIALRVIQGISVGLFTTATPTLLAQIVPNNQLIRTMGIFSLFNSASGALGPFVGLALIVGGDFTPLFILGIVLNIASIIIGLVILILNPIVLVEEEIKVTTSFSIFKSSALFPSITTGLLMFIQSGFMAFLALHGKSLGLDNIGFFFLFNFSGLLIARLLTTKLTKSISLQTIFMIHGALYAFACFLISFISSQLIWSILAIMLGYSFNVIFVILNTLALNKIPNASKGSANALFFGSIDIGFFLGGLVWGIVANTYSTTILFQSGSVLMIILTLNIILRVSKSKIALS